MVTFNNENNELITLKNWNIINPKKSLFLKPRTNLNIENDNMFNNEWHGDLAKTEIINVDTRDWDAIQELKPKNTNELQFAY